MRIFMVPLYVSIFLSGLACDDGLSKTEGEFEPPTILEPGKDDGLGDAVEFRGRISFGGEEFGEFVQDDQLDGWIFTAAEGAIVTVDNSNLGTTRRLDSTLFLYGPKQEDGFYGSDALIFDDDSGWGTHARIKDFTIPADGEYLIVMGTFMNIDRGRYRLALLCGTGSCVLPCDENCLSEDPCSGQTCSEQDGCIDTEPDPLLCNSEKQILVSQSELLTSEDGDADSFTVKITVAPDSHLTVWVTSSMIDEGVLFPMKLLFCMEGYEETANGCTALEEGTVPAVPQWQREVEVTLTGVRDFQPNDDAEYAVQFELVSEDEDYAALAPADIFCINLDSDAELDYSNLDGLADEALCAAMLPLVDGHQAYGYLGQNSARTLMFSAVDLHDGWVESIYNGSVTQNPRDSSQAYAQGFNTEHSWPQSHFDQAEPMKSDLHHVFPTDVQSNSVRSSYDFGWTDNPDAAGSFADDNAGEGADRIYQVRPARRGDIARAHFYMAVRYRTAEIEGKPFDDDKKLDNGVINDFEEQVLRAWHEADPVDEQERNRNNRIEAYQGNRNPFIDQPNLVDRISDF